MVRMAMAIFNGSSGSGGFGLPVATPQNLQLRVQISPKIINVAVPLFQHSPILGQLPLVQMVCRWLRSTRFRTFAYVSPEALCILSHGGRRRRGEVLSFTFSVFERAKVIHSLEFVCADPSYEISAGYNEN
jgi:hypothetical protein